VAEHPDGIVCTACRLRTLLAVDADSNVTSLNHSNVVGTVPDSQADALGALLDKIDNFGLGIA
jgi:hypothetical protein